MQYHTFQNKILKGGESLGYSEKKLEGYLKFDHILVDGVALPCCFAFIFMGCKKSILLQREKCHGLCLCAISSAVYGPMGTKLGREVGVGHGKDLAGPVPLITVGFSL